MSVVVATRNRSGLLRGCLGCLDRQTVRGERFEVIVVVDGATDDTLAMLAALRPTFALEVVETPGLGAASARNAGAARAGGRLLMFLDDDEEAEPGVIGAHLALHRARGGVVGCGAVARRIPERADRYARLSAQEGNARIEEHAKRPLTYWDFLGGNVSLRRSDFERAGGFALDLPRENDTEFGYRLHQLGLELVFLADARVSELRTRSWRGIVADAEQRGRIAVELYRRHPAMIAEMPLGRYGELPRTASGHALFAAALALRVPPTLMALAGFALPRERWARVWLFSQVLVAAYWRGVRASADRDLWQRVRSGTVILNYHAFGAAGERPSRYVVPGSRLRRQLAWLGRRGYNVIGLDAYLQFRSSYRLPPPKTVVITMDDGYLDNVTVAAPILEELGLTATVFVISGGEAGRDGRGDPTLARRPLVDGDALARMSAGPFAVGAHTRTHPDLTAIPKAEAQAEIEGSKRELESVTGAPVTTFAYPFGASDPEVRSLVARAGFAAARGTHAGRNRAGTDAFDLRRVEVPGTWSLPRFAATLMLGDLRG